MNTVKISKELAATATELFNAGKTPWIFAINGDVISVHAGRAAARTHRSSVSTDGHVAIVKAADVKFEIIADDEAPAMEQQVAAIIAPVLALAAQGSPEAAQALEDVAVALAQKQGDDAANAAEVVEGTATGSKIPLVRESTIERPCKQVWHIASAMLEAVGNDLSKLRRKDVLARCVASGIAFYTARTQYQMWLTIQNGGTL